MRTMVAFHDDLGRRLKQLSLENQMPFKAEVNGMGKYGGRASRFRVKPHKFDLRAGFDRRFNQLADELKLDATRRP